MDYIRAPRRIHNILIYKRKNTPLGIIGREKVKTDSYRMSDGGQFVGMMHSRVIRNYKNKKIYPAVKKCDTLCIEKLIIENKVRHKGYGSIFLKVAERESKRQNCNGRVHLIASPIFDLNNPPHIFYRKNGLETVSERTNHTLDICITNNETQYFDPVYMYLPIGDKPVISKKSKIKNFFKTYLNLRHKGEI